MKLISNFITEKLIINKDSEVNGILDTNYIINVNNWPRSRVAILVDVLKGYVKSKRKELTKDQIKFSNDLRWELNTYWETHINVKNNDPDLIRLTNGEAPDFKNLKCLYDAIQWSINEDPKCSKPRKHKLELILKELERYEDKIQKLNW